MTYDAKAHMTAFRAGATDYIDQRGSLFPRKHRQAAVKAALANWPARGDILFLSREEVATHIYHSAGYRKAMKDAGYGSIWIMLLFSVLQLLVQYWFQTRETEGHA